MASGKSDVLLSCEECLGIPLESLQGIGHHLALRGDLVGFLQLQQEALGSSQVVMWTSGNLSCCLREVESPYELQVGAWVYSQVTAPELGLISH